MSRGEKILLEKPMLLHTYVCLFTYMIMIRGGRGESNNIVRVFFCFFVFLFVFNYSVVDYDYDDEVEKPILLSVWWW